MTIQQRNRDSAIREEFKEYLVVSLATERLKANRQSQINTTGVNS